MQVRAHHDAAFKFHMQRRDNRSGFHCGPPLRAKTVIFDLAPKAFQWGTYPVERGTRPGFNAALARSAGALIKGYK